MLENEADCYVVAVELMVNLLERKGLPPTWIPVIVYGQAGAAVKAFLAGATDYLKEPWDVLELDFRLKKIFSSQSKNYRFHEQELTIQDTLCSTSNAEIKLSLPESKLLRAMLKQRGTLVPRDVLSYALWGKIPHQASRVMDVHISALRKKLRLLFPNKKSERFIYSAKGKGYILL
jgi:DNA-binding response OmpR family regulator